MMCAVSCILQNLQTFSELKENEWLYISPHNNRYTLGRLSGYFDTLSLKIGQLVSGSITDVVQITDYLITEVKELKELKKLELVDQNLTERIQIVARAIPLFQQNNHKSIEALNAINRFQKEICYFDAPYEIDNTPEALEHLVPFDLKTFKTASFSNLPSFQTVLRLSDDADQQNSVIKTFISERTLLSNIAVMQALFLFKKYYDFSCDNRFLNASLKGESLSEITSLRLEGKPLVIPIVLRSWSDHITVILIKDGCLYYYDSKAKPASSTWITSDNTLLHFLEKIKTHLNLNEIIENKTCHQSDSYNCGGYILHFIYQTLLCMKTLSELEKNLIPEHLICYFRQNVAKELYKLFLEDYSDEDTHTSIQLAAAEGNS